MSHSIDPLHAETIEILRTVMASIVCIVHEKQPRQLLEEEVQDIKDSFHEAVKHLNEIAPPKKGGINLSFEGCEE